MVLVTTGSVLSVTMISTRGIFSTGEKKCMPMTRSGCAAFSAIWVMGRELVLLAKIPPTFVTSSSSVTICCLRPRISGTASMVICAVPKPAQSRPPLIRFSFWSRSCLLSFLRLTPLPKYFSAYPIPACSPSQLMSLSRTE